MKSSRCLWKRWPAIANCWGNQHPDTLLAINNVATLRHLQGQLDEAELLYVEVLEYQRTLLGDRHPDTLSCISDMANLRSAQGRLDEAELLYVEALVGYRDVLGDEHPNTRMVASNMERFLRP
jgi:Tetratricopeptide repeat